MSMANWASFMQSTQLRDAARRREVAARTDGADPKDPAARILAAFGSSTLLPLGDILKATGLSADEAAKAIETLRTSNQVEAIERPDTGVRYLELTPYGLSQISQPPG